MATATLPHPPAAPAVATPAGVIFHGVSWDDYLAVLRMAGDGPVRVTFDRGRMELRMPTLAHDDDSHLLGRIVDTVTEELGVRVKPGGSTTHKRHDLDRGAEPDRCFWLAENAARMAGRRQLDLARDPAPDLVIEVDVTSSAVPRLPIFAAMGVPEVWHLTGAGLRFLHLQPDGSYTPRSDSLAFPMLTAGFAEALLERARVEEDLSWIRDLRDQLRAQREPAGP